MGEERLVSTLLKSQKGYRRLCRLRFTEKKESVLNLGTERLLQVLYSHPVVHISIVHSLYYFHSISHPTLLLFHYFPQTRNILVHGSCYQESNFYLDGEV